MKLSINRSRHTAARNRTHAGMLFAVSFHLALTPEERQWVEQLSLLKYWVSCPELCPEGSKCTTPRWTVEGVLTGVQLRPHASGPGADSYASLRQAQHAEVDVQRGCERLAETLNDARQYQGVEEIFFGEKTSKSGE